MNSCADSHVQIFYKGTDCPVCVERLRMDELVNGKTDIDEENINKLFDIVSSHEKHLRIIEDTVGIEPSRKRTFMDVILRR